MTTRNTPGRRSGTRTRSDRRADLAAIHVLKARLGWTDDEYRDIMGTVCGGIRSAANLDTAGRQRFLQHQHACVHQQTGGLASMKQRLVQGQLTARQRRMWSLWMQLVDAGLANGRTMAALNAFAARQTGVAHIGWLNADQEALVIESLKAWLKRGG